MNIKIYQVDAFATKLFSGNPAAVCPLNAFLPNDLMQSIAAENNLPETAFIIPQKPGNYAIRWFSPTHEVSLCGHATLAAAYIIFNILKIHSEEVNFESASGILKARIDEGCIQLVFPSKSSHKIETPLLIKEAINHDPVSVLASDDYIVILKDQRQIETLEVDQNKLIQLDRRGVIFTAPGNTVDFVSRVFHPKLGIGEDPVCGSAHCEMMPYWSKVLGKNKLSAQQLSKRGGHLLCELVDDRVYLSGKGILYMTGEISLPNYT